MSGVHLNVGILKAGVEESIVNAPWMQITNQLFKFNFTFCVVCVFTLQMKKLKKRNIVIFLQKVIN
jgi:hypothetical protein